MSEQRTVENPLTQDDRKMLISVKRRIGKLMDLIEKMEAAGIGCGERREVCTQMHSMADALEKTFPETGIEIKDK